MPPTDAKDVRACSSCGPASQRSCCICDEMAVRRWSFSMYSVVASGSPSSAPPTYSEVYFRSQQQG